MIPARWYSFLTFFIVVIISTYNRSAKTVLSLRDKKQKVIAIYLFIAMIFFTIIAVGTSFVICDTFFQLLMHALGLNSHHDNILLL